MSFVVVTDLWLLADVHALCLRILSSWSRPQSRSTIACCPLEHSNPQAPGQHHKRDETRAQRIHGLSLLRTRRNLSRTQLPMSYTLDAASARTGGLEEELWLHNSHARVNKSCQKPVFRCVIMLEALSGFDSASIPTASRSCYKSLFDKR